LCFPRKKKREGGEKSKKIRGKEGRGKVLWSNDLWRVEGRGVLTQGGWGQLKRDRNSRGKTRHWEEIKAL